MKTMSFQLSGKMFFMLRISELRSDKLCVCVRVGWGGVCVCVCVFIDYSSRTRSNLLVSTIMYVILKLPEAAINLEIFKTEQRN